MGILGRPKQPRCKHCCSDRPLPFGEDTCDVCKRTCPACGRRVPYGGRGAARKLCPPCAELNVARLRCPCGRVFRKGMRRYCSVVCRRAALKIRAGGDAPAHWNPDLPSLAKEEQLHVRAASRIAMWFRARYNYEGPAKDVAAIGATVWLKPNTRMFEVRRTQLDFSVHGGLPERIPIDDEPRFDALDPPPVRYILVNRSFDALAAVSAHPADVKRWTREPRWVARYNQEDTILLCPRSMAEIQPWR